MLGQRRRLWTKHGDRGGIWSLYEWADNAIQGLTQTFMSSGPQDHQLRGSGGSTIFLVVLTTTNVTALVNLRVKFFHTCDVFPHR